MEDIMNPNYKGEKCPGCGERLPFLLTDLCNFCTHKRDADRIAALEATNRSVLQKNIDLNKDNKRLREAMSAAYGMLDEGMYATAKTIIRAALEGE